MKFAAKALLTIFLTSAAFMLNAQEYGVASYYSDKFHGKPTASGEAYDKDKYTAAHKTYAFGTIIKVTRLDNKKSVKVKVTDRGPYVNGRIVDLSRKAAEALDLVNDGTARVKVEVVDQASEEATTTPVDPVVVRPEDPEPAAETSIEQPSEVVTAPPKSNEKPAAQAEKPKATVKEEPPKSTVAPSPVPIAVKSELVTLDNYSEYGLYKIELEKPEKSGYAVQVASMTNYTSVMRQIADLQGHWFQNILLSVEPNAQGEAVFKLMLGPFDSQESATAYKASVKKKTGISGFVVDLAEINYMKK
ncbi:MAG: septal ring lytic transglycosylase RlpA family protein [Bacteroidetes bacterium]|nr:septal ring lytic transglycosylase RlpA family protein [Bacteroidota bacterium]